VSFMCTFHLLQNIISLHSIVVVGDVANSSKWLFLTPKKQLFSHILAKTSCISMKWWWGPLCTRLSWIIIVLTQWHNSLWVDMSLHSTHYSDSDSEQISLCSHFLMLHAQQRSNKYQFYSLWFDPTRAQIHNLAHLR
jgi:hypothetical protein